MHKNWLFLLLYLSLPFPAIAQLTPQDAVPLMQKGINLGNTLEPPLEGGWNNPAAQEYYFDLYKQAGFQTVRVRVRWDEHTADTLPYTINSNWMNRVEQIVDWALERDLFVIINAHHDDWIKQNYTNASYRARFDSIWTQISQRFKNKPEKLVFEVLNEPNGLTKAQNDEMHARILSIIRKTNPTRLVIIQGHNWGGSDELIAAAVPEDDYLLGSFHSYDPYLFGLQGQGTWGTTSDYNTLKNKFAAVKTWSDTHDVPVILGEFGSLRSCDYNSRMKHYRAYVEYARQYGFIACAWDDGGDFKIMERAAHKWDEVKDILIHTNAQAPSNLILTVLQDTLIKVQWTNPAAADTLYIEHRTPSGTYSRIAVLTDGTTSFIHSDAADAMYHHYRIVAKSSSSGPELYSQPMRIFLPEYVQRVRSLFTGAPADIPGTVEIENYDVGGEGLTYSDATATNVGGAYRTEEAVDIYSITNGGYYISSIWPGEWIEQTVTVQQSGLYRMEFYVGSRIAGGSLKLNVGTKESKTIGIPLTGNYTVFGIVTDTLSLLAGEQILRLTILDDPYFSIDKIVFTAMSEPVSLDQISDDKPFAVNQLPGVVMIIPANEHQIESVQLFNMNGQLMDSQYNLSQSVNIRTGNWTSGIYIIKVATASTVYSQKILITN